MNKYILDMNDADYRKEQGLSATMLKTLQKSPFHLRHQLDNPTEPTDEMVFGTAVHTKLLEPHRFAEMFVQSPKFDRRTTAGKEAAAKFEAENAGKHRLDPDEILMLDTMTSNVEEAYGPILSASQKEVSVFAKDPDFDIVLKGRMDLYCEANKTIYDIKTCQDCSYNAFVRDVFKGSYALQAYHYLFISRLAGLEVEKFVFIAVEKKAPFECNAYAVEFDPLFVHVWAERHKELRKVWAECLKTGVYPKPSQSELRSIIIR